jgi:predicted transcriptional regulator of viral defense system
MKFGVLMALVRDLPLFDLPFVVQLSGEPKRQLIVQLSHWCHKGWVVRLRRGFYTLASTYRTSPASLPAIANAIYYPSYLSGAWALAFHGMIPEGVSTYTSVTTRAPKTFHTPLGRFAYTHLKEDFFWGVTTETIEGEKTLVAQPEKALLDHFHLHRGEWSEKRLLEMRFQNFEIIDTQRLSVYCKQWNSPRLVRAIDRLHRLMEQERKDYHEL